jgi:hypothetical protein
VVAGTISFDTDQPDIDPSVETGTYRVGDFTLSVPQIGVSADVSSDTMQISVFNTTYNDQFFVYSSRIDSFIGADNIGGHSPFDYSIFLFGAETMFENGDGLPTASLDWLSGNASFTFQYDQSYHQILMVFQPVPIPGAFWLLGSGFIGLIGIRRRAIR